MYWTDFDVIVSSTTNLVDDVANENYSKRLTTPPRAYTPQISHFSVNNINHVLASFVPMNLIHQSPSTCLFSLCRYQFRLCDLSRLLTLGIDDLKGVIDFSQHFDLAVCSGVRINHQ